MLARDGIWQVGAGSYGSWPAARWTRTSSKPAFRRAAWERSCSASEDFTAQDHVITGREGHQRRSTGCAPRGPRPTQDGTPVAVEGHAHLVDLVRLHPELQDVSGGQQRAV